KSFLKYQISCLKSKKNNLKTNLYDLHLEITELELKLRKKLDFIEIKVSHSNQPPESITKIEAKQELKL
ncbi:hypothetical protein OC713_02535, partial [Sweet potato little leaf phytoplasma]|nr:hypothetical protein [Sweet potato little leaf phytoplasma]